jgi:hypothetical protein
MDESHDTGGATPAEPVREIPVAKPAPPPEPAPFRELFKPKTLTTVFLKNGQRLSGEVTRKDPKGFWFRLDEGTDFYVRRDEVAKKIEENT